MKQILIIIFLASCVLAEDFTYRLMTVKEKNKLQNSINEQVEQYFALKNNDKFLLKYIKDNSAKYKNLYNDLQNKKHPFLTPYEVENKIEEEVIAKVQKEYSQEKMHKEREDLIAKYKMYKLKDNVAVKINIRGVWRNVKGVFNGLYANKITIDFQEYSILDIHESDKIFFDKEKNIMAKEDALRNFLSDYNVKKRRSEAILKEKLTRDIYEANNYIFFRGRWQSFSEIMDRVMLEYKKENKYEVKENIRNRVYEKHGYTLKNNQWFMPQEVVVVDPTPPITDVPVIPPKEIQISKKFLELYDPNF